MKNRAAGVVVLTALGALSCLGFSIGASNAQAGATASKEAPAVLERKVERLERQVAALQKQVEELKQRPALVTYAPPSGQWQPHEPPPGTPFEFNGRTYYRIPLQQGNTGAVNPGGAAAAQVMPVRPASPAK